MPAARYPFAVLIATAAALLSSCNPDETAPGHPEILLQPPPLSYNFDVRPILARRCFPCHGPGDKAHLSDLRLNDPKQAETTWQFIDAGHPGIDGPLEGAILGPNPEEKAVLNRWIAEGASHEPHWAFQSLPLEVPLPAVPHSAWPQNEIDHFILAAYEETFTEPPALVDPAVWLDRTTRALTGHAPATDEIEELRRHFLADPEAALRDASERLLASPSFGKQMAAHWLTAAEVRESNLSSLPFQPFFDWVTGAFNRNLPYDTFLQEQLSGDLFENPRPEQLIATAFNRLQLLDARLGTPDPAAGPCHREEPQPPNPSWSNRFPTGTLSYHGTSATQRTDTFGSTALGLTLKCARCHDHPNEPITRRDYHSLVAFFNSIAEKERNDHPAVIPAPTLPLPTKEQQELLYRATLQEADAENLLRQARLTGEVDFQAWIANSDQLPVLADLAGAFSFDESGPTSPNLALGKNHHAERGTLPSAPGLNGRAVQFDGKTPVEFPGFFEADRWSAWTFSLLIKADTRVVNPSVLLSRSTGTGPDYHGFDLRLSHGRITARIYRDWPNNAIGIQSHHDALPHDQWALLTWTYDGSSRADGLRLYLNDRVLATEVLADHLWKRSVIITGDAEPPLLLGARPGDRGCSGCLLDDFQVFTRALTPLEVADLHNPGSLAAALAGDATGPLRDYYFSSIQTESRRLTTRLESARRRTVLAEEPIREISIMRELPAPLPLFLPGDNTAVSRDTPPIFPPLGASRPTPQDPTARIRNPYPTRLDLSRWLIRTDHPLTARIFVNRVWTALFGEGLVSTPGDFGILSPAPTHPDLLDWLARDFIDHGWDTKRLCKQIVLSNAWRTQATAD